MANLAANDGLSGRRPTSNVGKTGHLAHSGFLIFVAFASLPVSCQFHQLGTLFAPFTTPSRARTSKTFMCSAANQARSPIAGAQKWRRTALGQ